MCDTDRLLQIWSIRFSADQREIVAGASSGQIMVYDVEAKQRILNVYGHDDDGEWYDAAGHNRTLTPGGSQRRVLCG